MINLIAPARTAHRIGDEIVGDGVNKAHLATPANAERLAPVPDGRKNTMFKSNKPPFPVMLVRPRGSAVGFDFRNLTQKPGEPPRERRREIDEGGGGGGGGGGAGGGGGGGGSDEDNATAASDDSFPDVPGVLETESIAGASLEAMAPLLEGGIDDAASYYVDAPSGLTGK